MSIYTKFIKSFFLLLFLLMNAGLIHAQKYMTRSGYIGFYSSTPVEDIQADNNQVASILDSENGEIVFQVLMRAFRFEKKLMEEHFNENFVESEKFPKSTFEGEITNIDEVDFSTDGEYNVDVEGKLTIHGVTRDVSKKGVIVISGNDVNATSKFIVKPADYDIKIPAAVRDNIAREIEVTVEMNYHKM